MSALFNRPVAADLERQPADIAVQNAQREALYSDRWFGCEHPERPWDAWMVLHDCCPACLLAAKAGDANGTPMPPDVLRLMAERLERFGPAPRPATP